MESAVEPKIDLDNPKELAAVDAAGMLSVVERFAEQVEDALRIGGSDVKLPESEGLKAVVVLGMGGSGISGDVVAALAPDGGMKLPLITVKGYELPSYVDSDCLVFAVSYSGNTEETLDCLQQARNARARLVAVSSDGSLAEIADREGIPIFAIPGGLQPRAALGYLFVPILSALERMGVVAGLLEQLTSAVEMLQKRSGEYGGGSGLDSNPTKRLAKDLVGYLPVVYGSEGHLAVVSQRWKAQLNEMAKVPAFCNYFPELNHNETVGWQNLPDICSRCHLIVLREQGEHERVEKRIEVTLELLAGSVGHTTQICARGSNRLERMLDLIYFGDFTSVYLALLLGQDPTPVSRIDELKKRLAEPGRA
jgi:glucose/mannose-6-phosphate isomerase